MKSEVYVASWQVINWILGSGGSEKSTKFDLNNGDYSPFFHIGTIEGWRPSPIIPNPQSGGFLNKNGFQTYQQ
jgi:hypothetical protein